MILKNKILAVIPARIVSKGIFEKNLIKIDKTSLVGHAIKFCKSSKIITDIVVSSDSQKILDEAEIILLPSKNLGSPLKSLTKAPPS